jgi:hypothetical protein
MVLVVLPDVPAYNRRITSWRGELMIGIGLIEIGILVIVVAAIAAVWWYFSGGESSDQ